jgi:hypothetical protein
VATDQVGRATARTEFPGRGTLRLYQRRVLGEPEIIIAAKINERTACDPHAGAITGHRIGFDE